ncbi:MAG TPA: serine hydrolase domain-containing protein [Sphingomonadaceae bacterium]|nr:serine hydrolase domain-containing protein [Sphingomonadaceae bacterium]
MRLVQGGASADAEALAAGPSPDLVRLTAMIDKVAAAEMAAEHIPGLAIVLVQSGRTILKRGYGVADVATGRPVDPESTLFRIGSITKALTALAVTRVASDGRTGMNADVSRYVHNIRNLSGSDRPVTVKDLISHSSGFDQIGLDRQIGQFERPLAERKALRPGLKQFVEAENLRRTTLPGQLYRYDTYGITLAGLVLQRATGLPYAAAMRRELFDPLGMHDSFVEAHPTSFGQLAVGYGFVDGAYVAQPYEVYVTTPASSIDATPADMGRLLEALTSDGANRYGRLFDKRTLHAVLAPQFRPQPHCPGVTHGFFEGEFSSALNQGKPRTVGHGGNMLGFSSLLTIVPEAQLGVFVAANRDAEAGGGNVRIDRHITDLVLEQLAAPSGKVGPALQLADVSEDYSSFSGNYYFGAYCRTCTAAERARGAWSKGKPKVVSPQEGGVKIDGEAYLATTAKGVFLREDRKRHVCFGNDRRGWTSHFNFSNSPNTFERAE